MQLFAGVQLAVKRFGQLAHELVVVDDAHRLAVFHHWQRTNVLMFGEQRSTCSLVSQARPPGSLRQMASQ